MYRISFVNFKILKNMETYQFKNAFFSFILESVSKDLNMEETKQFLGSVTQKRLTDESFSLLKNLADSKNLIVRIISITRLTKEGDYLSETTPQVFNSYQRISQEMIDLYSESSKQMKQRFDYYLKLRQEAMSIRLFSKFQSISDQFTTTFLEIQSVHEHQLNYTTTQDREIQNLIEQFNNGCEKELYHITALLEELHDKLHKLSLSNKAFSKMCKIDFETLDEFLSAIKLEINAKTN